MINTLNLTDDRAPMSEVTIAKQSDEENNSPSIYYTASAASLFIDIIYIAIRKTIKDCFEDANNMFMYYIKSAFILDMLHNDKYLSSQPNIPSVLNVQDVLDKESQISNLMEAIKKNPYGIRSALDLMDKIKISYTEKGMIDHIKTPDVYQYFNNAHTSYLYSFPQTKAFFNKVQDAANGILILSKIAKVIDYAMFGSRLFYTAQDGYNAYQDGRYEDMNDAILSLASKSAFFAVIRLGPPLISISLILTSALDAFGFKSSATLNAASNVLYCETANGIDYFAELAGHSFRVSSCSEYNEIEEQIIDNTEKYCDTNSCNNDIIIA